MPPGRESEHDEWAVITLSIMPWDAKDGATPRDLRRLSSSRGRTESRTECPFG